MTDRSPVGVAVIGLGFMGRTHLGAYAAATRDGLPCRLVGVCDRSAERLADGSGDEGSGDGNIDTGQGGRLFDPASILTTTEPAELLARDDVDLVSICTHTDTHIELATQALEAGKHVLVEKPVALTAPEIAALARVADTAKRICMPAMCMRFWPGWSWLHDRIREGDLGPVRSAAFVRLGAQPDWGEGFYSDPQRSGAALVDLHIHDADFVRWCFGEPDAVFSTGSSHHVTTAYYYENGPAPVVAEGGWIATPGFPFRMRYLVHFEAATAEFDLASETPLLVTRAGKTEAVPLAATTGYDGEVRHLLSLITDGGTLVASLAGAEGVARLLAAERRSLETGERVAPAP